MKQNGQNLKKIFLYFLIGIWMMGPRIGFAEISGKKLFLQWCLDCHSIGRGITIGPDLKGVTERRKEDWLIQWIMQPEQMRAKQDPIVMELLKKFDYILMPNMGLSQAEAQSILKYLKSDEANDLGVSATLELSPILPVGDPVRGKKYFTGLLPFQNGGPPCIACHNVAGLGLLGSGASGPDLTRAVQRYGEWGLSTVLIKMSFPTMQPFFKNHPLNPEEQKDLRTFLKQPAIKKEKNRILQFALLTGGTFLILMYLIYRKLL